MLSLQVTVMSLLMAALLFVLLFVLLSVPLWVSIITAGAARVVLNDAATGPGSGYPGRR